MSMPIIDPDEQVADFVSSVHAGTELTLVNKRETNDLCGSKGYELSSDSQK